MAPASIPSLFITMLSAGVLLVGCKHDVIEGPTTEEDLIPQGPAADWSGTFRGVMKLHGFNDLQGGVVYDTSYVADVTVSACSSTFTLGRWCFDPSDIPGTLAAFAAHVDSTGHFNEDYGSPGTIRLSTGSFISSDVGDSLVFFWRQAAGVPDPDYDITREFRGIKIN